MPRLEAEWREGRGDLATGRRAQDECARTLHECEEGREKKNERGGARGSAFLLLLHCSHTKKGGRGRRVSPGPTWKAFDDAFRA